MQRSAIPGETRGDKGRQGETWSEIDVEYETGTDETETVFIMACVCLILVDQPVNVWLLPL